MRILDLCCGCGGFSLGFRDKYNRFLGIDIWDKALKSYQANLNAETIQADIRFLDVSVFKKHEFDIIIGSPPCQAFSTIKNINPIFQDFYQIPDMSIVNAFLKIKDELNPKFWIIENVPPITKFMPKNAGCPKILKACDFGLLHERRRAFYGNFIEPKATKKVKPRFPTPTASSRGYSCIFRLSNKNWQEFQVFFKTKKKIPDVSHYKFLMGFPRDYFLAGNKKEKMMQLGNAVCPPVSQAIYKSIINNKKLDDFLKKDSR